MDKKLEEQLDIVVEDLFNLQEKLYEMPLPKTLSKEILHNLLKVHYLICRYKVLEFDWDKKDWDKELNGNRQIIRQ